MTIRSGAGRHDHGSRTRLSPSPDDVSRNIPKWGGRVPALREWLNTPTGIYTRAVIGSALGGFRVVALAFLIISTLIAVGLWSPDDPRGYLVCAALCAVVVAGQHFPRGALIVTAVVVGNPYWDFSVQEIRALPVVIAVYAAVRAGMRISSALTVSLLSVISSQYPLWLFQLPFWADYYTDNGSAERILVVAITVAAVLLGRASWEQARNAEVLIAKNEDIQRLRKADQLRIAQEERTRIAREIHDVVAHHVAAIVIRAQAAARVADHDPHEPRAAVEWIASSGQEALTAMRDVVRVLRNDSSSPASQTPRDLAEALEALFERVRAANIRVDSRVEIPTSLSSVEAFTVLRVCQEALTNVLIHSGARTAMITLEADRNVVRLTVEDDGASSRASSLTDSRASQLGSGGSGLRGMRERADSIGATVLAGPTEQGWLVRLAIPGQATPQTSTAHLGGEAP